MKSLQDTHFSIIGAGISGIATARKLLDRGAQVTVFEKSRGFGGRCATKRWNDHIIDHGAQYFTIHDPKFKESLKINSPQKLMQIQAPVINISSSSSAETQRWYHQEGNSRLVRDLSRGLDVKTETPIENASSLLKSQGGSFDHVICTAPWPQSAKLMNITTDFNYLPCIAVIFEYEGDWIGKSADTYAYRNASSDLMWTSCENHKINRIRRGYTVIVAHMSASFSQKYLERPPEEYPPLVRRLIEEQWNIPSATPSKSVGHRWRYARTLAPLSLPPLPQGLHYVGDALSSSRIEDAWIMGNDFAEKWMTENEF